MYVTYRKFTSKDFPYVIGLTRSQIGPYVLRAISVQEVADNLRKNQTYLIYHNGDRSGFISFRPIGQRLYIDTIALQAGKQGQGIGRKVFSFLEKKAGVQGMTGLFLHVHKVNKRAIKAYSRYGFVREGQTQSQYIMDKKISR
ncbi:GNAT family N-acetyltransferase [Aneurinibacillus sp. BA2021]|nr:GNAT family N-acetyltransferase [Aneurinibacillus sp. BA2021]